MPVSQQVAVGFENENTVWRLKQAGKLDEFHKRYDEALNACRKAFGKTYPHIIGGKSVAGNGGTFPDENPSNTKEILGHFPLGSKAETEQAIEATVRAYDAWSHLDYTQRIRIIRKASDLLRKAKYEFAAWMTLENGKTRVESMNDVDEAIDMLAYYPLVYEQQKGFTVPMYKPFPNEDCLSTMKPYGAWAVIAPFNFPVAITVGMTTGCILTGNTAVLKPASDTPLVAYKFVELLEQAGVPAGVANFVTGSGSVVGQTLLNSPKISGVVFTGSREVGLRVIESSVKRSRPSITEMGGKNPIIVTAQSDLDKAVEGCARSAFGFSGQKCSAASRLYVQKPIYEEFRRRLVEWTRANCTMGNPEDPRTFISPVVTKRAHDNFLEYVEKAKNAGGTVLLGGASAAKGPLASGHFVEPTIVEGLKDSDWVTQNELFVPIVSLYSFDKLDEAVRRANGVEYGLTAGIFSEDPKEVQYFFDHIEAGVTYANRRVGGSTGAIVGGQSFGGWKHSGSTGRGAGGPWYLLQFLREQSQTRTT